MSRNEIGILVGFNNFEQILDYLEPKYKRASKVIRENIKSRYLYNTYMVAVIDQWDKEIQEKEEKKKVKNTKKIKEEV